VPRLSDYRRHVTLAAHAALALSHTPHSLRHYTQQQRDYYYKGSPGWPARKGLPRQCAHDSSAARHPARTVGGHLVRIQARVLVLPAKDVVDEQDRRAPGRGLVRLGDVGRQPAQSLGLRIKRTVLYLVLLLVTGARARTVWQQLVLEQGGHMHALSAAAGGGPSQGTPGRPASPTTLRQARSRP